MIIFLSQLKLLPVADMYTHQYFMSLFHRLLPFVNLGHVVNVTVISSVMAFPTVTDINLTGCNVNEGNLR